MPRAIPITSPPINDTVCSLQSLGCLLVVSLLHSDIMAQRLRHYRIHKTHSMTIICCSIHGYGMLTRSLRQGKAKQLHPKTTPLFSREKMSCLRRDSNLQVRYQLSHRGSSAGQAESLMDICIREERLGNIFREL